MDRGTFDGRCVPDTPWKIDLPNLCVHDMPTITCSRVLLGSNAAYRHHCRGIGYSLSGLAGSSLIKVST